MTFASLYLKKIDYAQRAFRTVVVSTRKCSNTAEGFKQLQDWVNGKRIGYGSSFLRCGKRKKCIHRTQVHIIHSTSKKNTKKCNFFLVIS